MKQYKRNYSCMHKTKMSLMVSVIVICMLLILALTIPTHAVTHTESQNNEIQTLVKRQNIAHEAANLLRELGYNENSVEIKGLQKIWWSVHNEIEKIKNTPPTPTPTYTEDELFCMAAVIYQEAGSDYICNECRYRVGDVVLNRVADKRFPNTIRSVLEQKNQYGRFYYTGVKFPARANYSGEKHAVERAYNVARSLLSNEHHSSLYGKGYVWQAPFVQGKNNVYCCNHYYGR